ncbi:helix-turn-helix transcriptional regulator [soil metagenome]
MTERPLSMGEIIRRQRELAALPMRQLAALAGISNPYLSQIERGLRAPSEQVLEAIARNLQTSAEELYAAAHTDEEGPPSSGVPEAIKGDPELTAGQKRALTEVYEAFRDVRRAGKG